MKTHFVPAGAMNTLCGYGFHPWLKWQPAGHAEARAVTCGKCRENPHMNRDEVSGVVQRGRPRAWNRPGMTITVRSGSGRER